MTIYPMLLLLHLVFCRFLLTTTAPPQPCPNTSCSETFGYPEKEINRAVGKSAYYRRLLGPNGISPMGTSGSTTSSNDLRVAVPEPEQPKVHVSASFEQACEISPVVTEYPKTARNIQNVTRYIVNTEEYRQPVTTEKCRNENEPCVNLSKFLTPGVSTSCRSSYVTLLLVVYDETKKALGSDQFSFPTACVCFYKNDH